MDVDRITVDGLTELTGALNQIESGLPNALRMAGVEGAEIVAGWARPRVDRRTGRAVGSVRVERDQAGATVAAGGPSIPYFPWLDFGGRVGRRKSVRRPFQPEGRYIWPGFMRNRDSIEDKATDLLTRVIRQAGVEVDR